MRHDVWYALRRLAARPWHFALVVAIFAVGTAASFTVYRLADAVLLHALPYRDADQLIHISAHIPIAPHQEFGLSDVGYRALERDNHTLAAVAAYRTTGVNLTRGALPERVLSTRVTANFFDVVGLRPTIGRNFVRGEETAHGPTVLVLSDAYWRRAFAADPSVIGRTVRIDGAPATIIAVADPRLVFPSSNVAYFTLMDLDPVGREPYQLGLDVLGRRKPGVSVETARLDATRIMQRVARDNPGPHRTVTSDVSAFQAVVRSLGDDIAGGVRPTLLLLLGAVACVLLLTLVNVATLELVRTSTQRASTAVRAALGASQARLVRGALIEGGIQALFGGAIGLALSTITVNALRNLVPSALSANMSMSATVLVVAGLIMIGCTLASAFFPVVVATRRDLQSALRERQSATRRSALIRRGLIVAQIGFACALVYGAVLLVLSVRDAQRVRLGFDPAGVVTFNVNLPAETYRTPAEVATAFDVITSELRSIPGIRTIGLASGLPLDPVVQATLLGVEGRPFLADGTDPTLDLRIVSADYFEAMHIASVAGRTFRPGDTYLDGTPVVISRSAVKVLFPDGGDPLGHRVRTGPFAPWMSIIGVVDDVRNRSLTEESHPELYLPFAAPRSPVGVSREMAVVVQASSAVDEHVLRSITSEAQRRLLRLNPDLPMYNARAYAEILRDAQTRERTTMRVLVAFAAVALLLAIAGSYALLMFSVVERRRELAVRMAVGANRRTLIALVGREMLTVVAVGAAAGMTGATLLTRVLSRYVAGVNVVDPRVWVGTLAAVAIAGVLSTLVPARRAAQVDPMLVLRGE